MPDSAIAMPAAAGLAAGVLLIAIFAIWAGNLPARPYVSTVTIVRDAGVANGDGSGSSKTFDPPVITVVMGVNNTVMWVNQDVVPYWIEPDTNDDPGFVAATKDVLITSDHPFQYTFTKEGKFGYHSKPWMQGEVNVLPAR
jgi:plastocyanin